MPTGEQRPDVVNNGRRGRRSGSPDTRAQILAVAHRRLLADGYHGVTLRGIAAEAGVDAALISYYFGSKRGLFGAALALTANPLEALGVAVTGDLDTLPERLLRMLVANWDDPATAGPLRVLIAGAVNDRDTARLVREVLETEMVPRLAERFGGRDATARAAAFGAQLAGLLLARYWLAVDPIASMSVDDVVRFASPGLHAAMRGPAPQHRQVIGGRAPGTR